MKVIVAHEKHGTFTYHSALTLLSLRLEDGYFYDNWDDGNPEHQWEDRAKQVLTADDEDKAWAFLQERSDHEYEYVEKQEVQ